MAKGGGSGKQKKDIRFAFTRLGTCTAPRRDGVFIPEAVRPAEFNETSLTIVPNIPRAEVSLTIQFRCSVHIIENDVISIVLPGFKGPRSYCTLESRPHADGLVFTRSFQAIWTGDEAIKKLPGMPAVPKQVLLLRCMQSVESNTLVIFGVPRALFMVCPDKLPANSSKIKIEGKIVRHAEGGCIPKQPFLTCSEIKKKNIADEIGAYEALVDESARLVGGGGSSRANAEELDKYIGEELTAAELDQVWEAGHARRSYPVSMPWSISPNLFRYYEDSSAFVKTIMENAVASLKQRNSLALHKEVASNWGVKIGAVVILEDVLWTLYGGMYPDLSRPALLAAHLLTMEAIDVARTFPVLSYEALPTLSIMQEIQSAYRQSTMRDANGEVVATTRWVDTLKKWSVLLSVIFTATMVVTEDSEENGGKSETLGNRQKTARLAEALNSGSALIAPPPLYVGVKDVQTAELQRLEELSVGEWYMFPSFTIARQTSPLEPRSTPQALAVWPSTEENNLATMALLTAKAGETEATETNSSPAEDEDVENIPDHAVLFEIRNVVEGLELADISMYPHNKEWLLPFSSSYRVTSITRNVDRLNGLIVVKLSMVGSLVGKVPEEYIPESDRAIATMIAKKMFLENETSGIRTSRIAELAYLNQRLMDRRKLHPQTLVRVQYIQHFQEVKAASEAKKLIEGGVVVWQVCLHPAQVLANEHVVKPATWEVLPRKFALLTEQFFLSRSRTVKTWEEGGMILDLKNYTVDYGGKGPRLLRRLIGKKVTHESPLPTYGDLLDALAQEQQKYLKQLMKASGSGKKKKKK